MIIILGIILIFRFQYYWVFSYAMMQNVKITSVNVRGLNIYGKRKNFLHGLIKVKLMFYYYKKHIL